MSPVHENGEIRGCCANPSLLFPKAPLVVPKSRFYIFFRFRFCRRRFLVIVKNILVKMHKTRALTARVHILHSEMYSVLIPKSITLSLIFGSMYFR